MSIFKSAQTAQFTFEVNGTKYPLLHFSAKERVSSPFKVRIKVASTKEISFDEMMGGIGRLHIHGQAESRYFNGIISFAGKAGKKGHFFLYSLEMRPVLWLLSFRKNIRIFQKKSIPDIVKTVLNDAGITSDRFEFRLKGTYEARDYCVQYRETDLDFITRLLADEGIFYYFEHDRSNHLMVLGNNDMNYMPIQGDKTLVFNTETSLVPEKEFIFQFNLSQQLHSGKVALKDFNFERPSLDLTSESFDKTQEQYEVYDYPGKYAATDKGKDLAKVRLEEQIRFKEVGDGKSISPRLTPGFTFTLDEHPFEDLNKGYFIVSITHEGNQPQAVEEFSTGQEGTSYENNFMVIPDQVVFRPTTDVKKPKIDGVQTAIVTGPKGEEIYVDKYGRVKVQFHWDRLGKNNEKSSCWIRVSQVSAGAGWGAMFIPRIGQEVIVDFIEGDPDRPIITGRVYHSTNMPPYDLPDERTKSTIKSNTSPDGKGFNEIRLEDKKGEEEIFIHGEKDWNIVIENDKNQSIGHDETLTVENDRSKEVKDSQKETIGKNKTIEVGKNHQERIKKNETISVSENADRTVGKNATLRVDKNASESIGENLSLDVGKSYTGTIKSDAKISVGKEGQFQIKGDMTLKGLKKAVIDISDQLTLKCGSASIILKKSGEIHIKGKKINLKASGDIKLKGSKISEN